MIFAAVDIGSNAMRLLFCRAYEVNGKPHFSKEELIRLPIRLGEDVFFKRKNFGKKSRKTNYSDAWL
jgi:exopolyphosphatase/guanosine-5'-triphosphate,3'-diphosphate pyrophosphatase